jgi:tRNA (mo5U34)-methyltransferase
MQAIAPNKGLSRNLPEFLGRIQEAKRKINPQSFSWYSYDILANVHFLETLLHEANLSLTDLVAGNPVLDIGCADGDLSFFMESLGCKVCSVDYPSTNANGMQGVRALKGALQSSVDILEVDIDRGFEPPAGQSYSLVILLGILYHLKNPYLILETLAEHAEYCVLSTRVTRYSSDRQSLIHDLPVAFLLDRGEANNDVTNYWIFSQAGLRRLVKRTGWEICASLDVGNTQTSDPVTSEGDERVFLLLRRADNFTNGSSLKGVYAPVRGKNDWRWTEPRFSVEFDAPAYASTAAGEGAGIEVDLFITDDHLRRQGSVTVTASISGEEAASVTFAKAGAHIWRIPVLGKTKTSGQFLVALEVSPGAPSTELDPRPFGLILNGIRLVN